MMKSIKGRIVMLKTAYKNQPHINNNYYVKGVMVKSTNKFING